MEIERPMGERVKEFDLTQLVETIKSVWEGVDFCFIQRTGNSTVDFTLTICNPYLPNAMSKIQAAADKIKELGYDAIITNSGKVNFRGVFKPEDITKFTDELQIINKYLN